MSEQIPLAKAILHTSRDTFNLASAIIGIFYYHNSIRVNQGCDIILEIADVIVDYASIGDGWYEPPPSWY